MNFRKKITYLLIFTLFASHVVADEEFNISIRDIAKVKQKSLFHRIKQDQLPKLRKRFKKKRKKINLREVKPPSSSSLYYSQGTDEAELESIQNEEINYLFKMLKKRKNSDLLIRLGTLYVEKARFVSFKIQSDYEAKLLAFKKGSRKTKPILNTRPAEVYNRKALKVFKKIVSLYPKHPRMDEVLFFLGFNSYELGLETEGAKYFLELLTKFPRSQYVYESQFQLGEHYYIKQNWNKANSYYLKVSAKKRGKFYFFALYKLAWVSYKKGQVSRGLNYLTRIIKESVSARRSRIFTFALEAENDLMLFYSYSRRDPLKARQFFTRLLGAKKAHRHLKKLAYSYRDIGSVRGVHALFNYLIEQDPKSPDAFEYKYQQVQTVYDLGSSKRIYKLAGDWVKEYGKSSLWAKVNSKSRVKRAHKLLEVTLRDYALRNHQAFRKRKSSRNKSLALYFYKLYFDEFRSDQMTFFYAELLFDSKRYKAAVKKYEEMITRYPRSKRIVTTYQNQILALDKILPSNKEIKKIVDGSKAPVDFPSEVNQFLTVADRYLKKFPTSKNAASISYRVAALYYSFNHLKEASVRFRDFSEKYPSSHYISSVGGVLLDVYNKNKDYKSLEKLASNFINNKSADKSLVQESKFVLQQLSFKKAQDLALNKDFVESASLYRKFAEQNPRSALASVAYFNAGLNYEKVKNYEVAVKMYAASLNSPNNKKNAKIKKKSREFLPVLYEKLGYYKQAAQGYSSYARLFPKEVDKVKSYWYNAGVIYDALNAVPQAVQAYNNYYRLKTSSAKWEARYLIASLYERNRNWGNAIKHYKLYAKSGSGTDKYSVVKSSFKIAKIYKDKLKQSNNASYWYKETIGLHKRLRTGTHYAAGAYFRLVYNVYNKFKSIKLPRQASALKKAVERKTSILKELEDSLRSVVRYNDGEYLVAALTLTGLAQQDMAEVFYKAPIPKGLDKKGKKQYREGIKNIITPYLVKASKSYELALDKAKSLRIYGNWASVANKKLNSFSMKDGKFESFTFNNVQPEWLSLRLMDDAGTAGFEVSKEGFAGVGKEVKTQLTSLAFAVRSRRENKVLNAVAKILNQDPNDKLALHSLGVFYIQNRRPSLGILILNRIKDKKDVALLNNLGVAYLKQGNTREAVKYFKKAIKASSSHIISRANLGTLFVQKEDFHSALHYLGDAYNLASNNWGSQSRKAIVLANNYGVALQGTQKWTRALVVFNKISRQSAPPFEALFNKALTIAEGFNDEKSLNEAKSLVNELRLSSNSVRFKKKLDKILDMLGK